MGDIWVPTNQSLLEVLMKFFKHEHNGKLAVGDNIIRLEFTSHTAFIPSWKLFGCEEGNMVWAYASSNDIHFINKIKNNQILVMKLEEEHNELATELWIWEECRCVYASMAIIS